MLDLMRTWFLLAFIPAVAAGTVGCGGDSPSGPSKAPLMIRAEGYVHSQTDGSPVYRAKVALYQIDYIYGTARAVGPTVLTNTEGYYSFEAEYPYSCQTETAGKPFPRLTAYRPNAYSAGDRVPDCSDGLQRLDFELVAWSDILIDSLIFSPDTLRLGVGESALLSVIVVDANADTVSSRSYPHFPGNEGLRWMFASDVATLSHVSWNAVTVTGQAVGTAAIGVSFTPREWPHRPNPETVTGHGIVVVE